jgi:hypothetical protein
MASEYLASAALTGGLLVALAVGIARTRHWHRSPPTEDRDWFDFAESVAQSPTAWVVAFLALALGAGVGSILFVSGSAVPAIVHQGAFLLVVLLFVVSLGGYAFWGAYQAVRSRGVGSAQAALAGLWLVGSLFLLAVVVRLLTTGP